MIVLPHENDRNAPLSILVALASYGTSNDRYLERLIREYQSMPFNVDIVVLSNIEKKSAAGVECRVGLPTSNPWSLPFAHKKLFADHASKYDLFIYSEDDILVTEGNIRAFLDVTTALQHDEIAGFLRIEKGANGEANYPDIHAYFHWDPTSVRSRGRYTLAHFTNEHAACYLLTQEQLKRAISSGGFLVEPHEEKYDLLCTAATDPYTQCGFKKLVPVSHIDDFTVHHLSNKYVGRVGVSALELRDQTEALIRISGAKAPSPLFNTETKLPHRLYSKDYYEPASEDVLSAIPSTARNVLSIGCGWGATEKRLVERGLRVVALPLDPVVASGAAARGVEMLHGDIKQIATLTRGEQFDCILCLNVLHLAYDPAAVLSSLRDCLSEDAMVIIQSPSMMSLRTIRRALRGVSILQSGADYASTGVHFSSVRSVRNWCSKSGMRIDRTIAIPDRHGSSILGKIASAVGDCLPASLATSVAASILISARRLKDGRSQHASTEPSLTQRKASPARLRIVRSA